MVDYRKYKKYQFIAIISGIFTIIGFSHLVYKVYKTQQTQHLTYTWLLLVLTAQALIILYGILTNSYGIYLPSIILITGLLYILYVKLNKQVNTDINKNKINSLP